MKNLFLALFLFASFVMSAQEVEVNWGPRLEKENDIAKYIGESGSRFYILSYDKDKIYLDTYSNTTFEQESSKLLVLPEIGDKEQQFEEILLLGEKLVLFTSLYDKKSKLLTSNAYIIHESGEIDPGAVEIFSYPAEKFREAGYVSFFQTQDKKSVVATHRVYYKSPDDKKKTLQKITIRLFDNALHEVYEVSQDLPDNASLMTTETDEGGNLYLITKSTDWTAADGNAYSYIVLSVNPDGSNVEQHPLGLDGKIMYCPALRFESPGNIIITGLYGNLGGGYPANRSAGQFSLRFDPRSGKSSEIKFYPYEMKFMESSYAPKRLKKLKENVLSASYVSGHTIETGDGGWTCILEEYYHGVNSSSRGSVESFYYGNIIVSHFLADGTMEWSSFIPKQQRSTRRSAPFGLGLGSVFFSASFFTVGKDNTMYYSYQMLTEGNKIFLVFNDSPENIHVKPLHQTTNVERAKGTVPVLVTIDSEGEVSKTALFDAADIDITLMPRLVMRTSPAHVYIYGSKGDDNKFGEMKIK